MKSSFFNQTYTVTETEVDLGNAGSFRITHLKDLEATIDQLFAQEGENKTWPNKTWIEDHCPYFACLWPSGLALAHELANRPKPKAHETFLELGAGLALPSFAAARLGYKALATDLHPDALLFFNENKLRNFKNDLNSARASFSHYDWNVPESLGKQYPIIVAADVLYEKKQIELLLGVLRVTMKSGSHFLITDQGRPYFEPFVVEAVKHYELIETKDILLTNIPGADQLIKSSQRTNPKHIRFAEFKL